MRKIYSLLSFRTSVIRVRYGIFLLLSPFLLTTSCSNDDDNSQDPISQLPPATTTGENTFGALLDGEPFIPRGGVNPLDCVYQLVNGERFFGLQGNKRNENFNLLSLSLSTNAKEIEQGRTYPLIEEADGNATGIYGIRGDLYFTNAVQTGEMTITRLDMNAQIVSGTFFFDVIDEEGNLRQIREGRFDMRFTQ